jgi:anion-transporting  ArsA/GET3 family ATPase
VSSPDGDTLTTTHSVADVVDGAHLLVTCGPGGVGKTTCAAALALAAARAGRKVVVVTVDPARRLADSLGMEAHTNEPVEVAGATDGAPTPGGSLWALMLDAEATFDQLVRSEAGDSERADSILRNPVYRSITGALAGSQEYMAIERLHQLHATGEYDLVVVDTPPSRHALDLLEAPQRLTSFLGHPVYRTLTAPTRAFARVANAASSAFLWTVRRLAGPSIVEDTLAFFRAISGMEEGLRRRAAEVAALLHDERTAFVVVSSPRAEAVAESTFLLDALHRGEFPVGAVVVNLVHPLPAEIGELPVLDPGPLAEQVAHHADLLALAVAERAEMAELLALVDGAAVAEVPLLAEDVHDVPGLVAVAAMLSGDARR